MESRFIPQGKKNNILRGILCNLGIHRFRDNDIWGDDTVSLPIRGISGYCYSPKEANKRTTGDQWRFRECKFCGWGEFKKPYNMKEGWVSSSSNDKTEEKK